MLAWLPLLALLLLRRYRSAYTRAVLAPVLAAQVVLSILQWTVARALSQEQPVFVMEVLGLLPPALGGLWLLAGPDRTKGRLRRTTMRLAYLAAVGLLGVSGMVEFSFQDHVGLYYNGVLNTYAAWYLMAYSLALVLILAPLGLARLIRQRGFLGIAWRTLAPFTAASLLAFKVAAAGNPAPGISEDLFARPLPQWVAVVLAVLMLDALVVVLLRLGRRAPQPLEAPNGAEAAGGAA